MKIYRKIVLDMKSGKTLEEQSFDYEGDLALCGGGDGGGDQETTIRYAPYIEEKHQDFLDTIAERRSAALYSSPYKAYTDIDIDPAFFGTGYLISSFPSLYDMYGKFMAGLDIDTLYSQIFEDTVNAPEINNLVSAEAAMMDDDIDMNIYPRFQAGMRDINSVMGSSFVLGRAAIEDARVKVLSRFSAELKYRMIPVVAQKWGTHLDWNKGVVANYAEMIKLYYSAKMDIDNTNYSMGAKNVLWPFTVLDFERAALGALQGATKTTSEVAGESGAAKAISGALGGAAAGAMATGGNPIGAIAGGIIGLAASFL